MKDFVYGVVGAICAVTIFCAGLLFGNFITNRKYASSETERVVVAQNASVPISENSAPSVVNTTVSSESASAQAAIPQESATIPIGKIYEVDGETAKLLRYDMEPGYDGQDNLVLYFEYTNGSDEITGFYLMKLFISAFQNKIELDSGNVLNDEWNNNTTKIQPGGSLDVIRDFLLQDHSPVDVYITGWINNDDILLDHFVINP